MKLTLVIKIFFSDLNVEKDLGLFGISVFVSFKFRKKAFFPPVVLVVVPTLV